MNNIAPKLQKYCTHKIAFKIISKMLKQPNFFYSQSSTLPKEALAKVYLYMTFGLSFMISSVAPSRLSAFYACIINKIENRNLDPACNYPCIAGKDRCNISSKHCFRSVCIINLFFNFKDRFLLVQHGTILCNGKSMQKSCEGLRKMFKN